MNIRKIVPCTVAAAVAFGAAGGIALAKESSDDSRDTAILAKMTVTLSQAIATAEQQSGGRAVGADVSQAGGSPRVEVEVTGPQGSRTVLVDGRTGQVTETRESGQNEDVD